MTELRDNPHLGRKYGWKPSLPDHRDIACARGLSANAGIAAEVDMRHGMPEVYDQGQLGSCTANAIGAALEFHQIQHYADNEGTPSRLFIYYMERLREGTVQTDSGAYGRDGFAVLRKTGAPPEALWPYDITKFRETPPEDAYAAAGKHRIKNYVHPGNDPRQSPTTRKREMQAHLSASMPIAFGFTVYESFESGTVAEQGIVPMPAAHEAVLGGHEVLMVGYLAAEPDYALCRNSWGNGWGMDGYFLMPWNYLLNPQLASDFRCIAEEV